MLQNLYSLYGIQTGENPHPVGDLQLRLSSNFFSWINNVFMLIDRCHGCVAATLLLITPEAGLRP